MHPAHGGKAPMKRARRPVPPSSDDDEDEEEDEKDPLVISNEKVKQQTALLKKQRRKQLTLAVHKFNKHFKSKVVSQDYFDKMVKMIRAIRNHMDGSGTTVMYAEDLIAFRRNALDEDASRHLFAYDMRYGQRKKEMDTLHTVSVYGELAFKNDIMVSNEPFQYMVSDNDLCIAIHVDGEEWEDPEAFYTLLRFIIGCSGKRGNKEEAEDDDGEIDVGEFTKTQLTFMRNMFLEILSHYFRELVKRLNRSMYPQNSFPSPDFIVRCIEECKQW
jgi:hypothetical protein